MSDDMTITHAEEGGTSRRRMLAGMGLAAGTGLVALAGTQQAQASVNDASYYSYGPTRYADSRINSGGRIYGGQIRNLAQFAGGASYTFAVNLTVVSTHGTGYLSVYNADLSSRPTPYSSINWQGNGKVVANFTMLDLGAAGVNIFCSGGSSTNTHFIIDVVGFFINNGAAAARALPERFTTWEKKVKAQLERDSR
jgi:hypothetical protein